jgi:hypothetical protein
MSIAVKGKIEYQDLGMGTWVLISETGETYELHNPPSELCQSDIQVQLTGKIRNDVMTVAMIGPVLEVESFQKI